MDNQRTILEDRFTDAALALLMDCSAETDGELLWEQYHACGQTMPPELDQACQKQTKRAIEKK